MQSKSLQNKLFQWKSVHEICDAPTVASRCFFLRISHFIIAIEQKRCARRATQAETFSWGAASKNGWQMAWCQDDTHTWGACTHYQFQRVSLSHATIRVDCHAPRQINSLSFARARAYVLVLFCAKLWSAAWSRSLCGFIFFAFDDDYQLVICKRERIFME